jgi:hypothetical protein
MDGEPQADFSDPDTVMVVAGSVHCGLGLPASSNRACLVAILGGLFLFEDKSA